MAIDLTELATAISQLTLRFRLRRRLKADWTSSNEVLLDSEEGYEKDTGRFKIGDGTTPWNSLAYLPRGKVVSVQPGSNVTIDNTDPENPIIAASSGGGSGAGAAWEALMVAAASETPASWSSTAEVSVIDVTTTTGNIIGLAFGGMAKSSTFKSATNAVLTVPSGKTAYLLDAKFDSGTQQSGQYTYYKSRLYNSTTSTAVGGPNNAWGTLSGSFQSSFPGPFMGLSGNANTAGTWPVAIATAGQTIVAQYGSAGDANTRFVIGAYLILLK